MHGLEAVQYRLGLLGYLQVQPGEFFRTTVEPQRVRRHPPYPLSSSGAQCPPARTAYLDTLADLGVTADLDDRQFVAA
ncbi:hypothetical protein OG765_01015 [Streptomyces sp. NBC_00555]|uniref:hypothetical protein n=1 Tax=Streptomyces sp. NBC_00555 TaxID=2903662 RepID=UPI002256A372|nr:hypothetical protein [Streptomyces sp. NBC_00555]MCX5009578.1 hypothetical protein [Streptomyces sp. NBC_00555]